MDINNITKGKAIPLGIIIIIICFLTSGTSSSVAPFVLITTIIIGLIKNNSISESSIAGGLTAVFGSFIIVVFQFIMTYFIYGSLYAQYILSSNIILFILNIVSGVIGGAIGYFVSKELTTH